MYKLAEVEAIRVDEKKLAALANTLPAGDQQVILEALDEIAHLRWQEQKLQDELNERKQDLKETVSFLSNWARGFESLLQNPLNWENEDLLQTRHQALRESTKNLVTSCRLKLKSLMQPAE